jgi:hypothetical protein
LIRRLIPIAIVGLALAAVLPAPALAQDAQPCPTSIRPIVGGGGDATSGGYDDGVRGTESAYTAGELIVMLQPSASLADLRCLARELGATIIGGGVGKNGVAGVDDAVLLQLGPRKSVTRTRDLLLQKRYADLIAGAQANAVGGNKALTTVNDPLFNVQWGLWNGGIFPNNGQTIALPPPTTAITGRKMSMRTRSAWQLLSRLPYLSRVRLSIIDDSLVQHPDLEANVDGNGSALFRFGPTATVTKVTPRAGQSLAITRDGVTSCVLPDTASVGTVKDALEKRYPVFCNVPTSTTRIVSVTATSGTFTLTDGTGTTPAIAFDTTEADLKLQLELWTGLAPGDVDVRLERAAAPRTYRVIVAKPQFELFADGSSLQGAGAVATVASDAVQTYNSADNGWVVRFTTPPQVPITVVPAGAGLVNATRDIERVENRWPGQASAGATHGQNIAGMIGATGNNGVGITGVLGPRSNVLMSGLVTGGKTILTAAAVQYASEELNAKVVNMSLGWGGQVNSSSGNPRAEDPMDEDIVNRAVGEPGAVNTLFVVAASNEATNVNDSGPRNANPRMIGPGRAQETDLNPCRPKGMGIIQRPQVDADYPQRKGGSLSKLQMPDGTYDRGNLLCVGALAPDGNVANFSMWGRNIIDVGAPGESIIGTNATGGYDVGAGTSYAAPYVAAVAAMVYEVYPQSKPWLVKCAILSSATSQPLARQDGAKMPFQGYPAGTGIGQSDATQVFTVHGMVNAAEAISAAGALTTKVAAAEAGSAWPTCVQKRRKTFFQAITGRPGAWRDVPIAP